MHVWNYCIALIMPRSSRTWFYRNLQNFLVLKSIKGDMLVSNAKTTTLRSIIWRQSAPELILFFIRLASALQRRLCFSSLILDITHYLWALFDYWSRKKTQLLCFYVQTRLLPTEPVIVVRDKISSRNSTQASLFFTRLSFLQSRVMWISLTLQSSLSVRFSLCVLVK